MGAIGDCECWRSSRRRGLAGCWEAFDCCEALACWDASGSWDASVEGTLRVCQTAPHKTAVQIFDALFLKLFLLQAAKY